MRTYTYIIERQNRRDSVISYRVGSTNNIARRSWEHLRGRVKSTKGYDILRIAYAFSQPAFPSMGEHEITERYVQKQVKDWREGQVELAFGLDIEGQPVGMDPGCDWHPYYQRCELCHGMGFGKRGSGGTRERMERWFPEDAKPGDYYCEKCNGHNGIYFKIFKLVDEMETDEQIGPGQRYQCKYCGALYAVESGIPWECPVCGAINEVYQLDITKE